MSGWLSDKGWGGDLASPGPIGNVTPSTGAFTTLSATTSVTSPIVKANGSGGGVLQSNNGTACLQWGAGGGSNVTFDGGASALDNIIISTAGKGISFSGVTPPAGMTSQLLSDYEEGICTVTAVPDTGTITLSSSYNTLRYTKIGRLINISGTLVVSAINAPTGNVYINGLPYTCGFGCGGGIAIDGTNAFVGDIGFFMNANQTALYIYYRDSLGAYATSASIFAVNSVIRISINYTI